MNNIYATNKIDYHPRHIDALRNSTPIAPIHVQLIPTNVCNHRCSFCSYRQKGYTSNENFYEKQSIPFSKLVEIVNDCKNMGVKAIQLTGGGEPTCYPQFLPLCKTIIDSGIDLGIVSNGSRFTEEQMDYLSKATWIRLSIDAGCDKTYESIRRVGVGSYQKVRNAIKLLSSKVKKPTIGVGFVINHSNWKEIVPATIAAREDGADNIRISAMFQDRGAEYFKEIKKRCFSSLQRSRITVYRKF